jgi:hypothetical protein
VAVGTVLAEIEIWNLDVMDAVEPVCVLGGALPLTRGLGIATKGANNCS